MTFPDDLCVGDILLYNTQDIVDKIIDLKTAGDVAHVEIYVGDGWSVASRNGVGVNLYPSRLNDIRKVRRLQVPFELSNAMLWFNNGIKGLPYGFTGLLEFENIDWPGKGLFCSQFATMFLAAGGAPMFADDFHPVKVCPFDFEKTRQAATIYSV